MWNLVGFQTRLRIAEQRRVLRMLPGLDEAEFLRYGSIHRNAYVNSPAALGPWRGGAAMLLYLVAGVAGVPWFANQESGMAFASFGYIIGFVPAAMVVGALASRGADRTVGGTVAIMVLGNLIIYAFGVPWLMASLNLPLFVGLESGLWPFVIGDALKIALAAGLLPLTWRLVGRHD